MSASPTAVVIGRRRFVSGAATVAGAAGVALAAAAPASAHPATAVTTVTAWRLRTEGWSVPRGRRQLTHCSCTACVGHATHKLFATLADAQNPALRAHPGCLCEPEEVTVVVPVVSAGAKPPSRAVFPDGGPVVDRRSTPTTVVSADGTVGLAQTGGEVQSLVETGLVGLAVGTALLALARRRHPAPTAPAA